MVIEDHAIYFCLLRFSINAMLDFAKAFGIVEYSAMLSIMTHMGFPDQWLLWMRMIFSSGASSILLNGVPGKQFHCKRGWGKETVYPPCFLFLQLNLYNMLLIIPVDNFYISQFYIFPQISQLFSMQMTHSCLCKHRQPNCLISRPFWMTLLSPLASK